jgi:hypothetical protein
MRKYQLFRDEDLQMAHLHPRSRIYEQAVVKAVIGSLKRSTGLHASIRHRRLGRVMHQVSAPASFKRTTVRVAVDLSIFGKPPVMRLREVRHLIQLRRLSIALLLRVRSHCSSSRFFIQSFFNSVVFLFFRGVRC